MKISITWVVIAVILAAGIGSGVTYWSKESQLSSLESANQEFNIAAASEVSGLEKSLNAYHQISDFQEGNADSLRLKLNNSIGDRLVMTEPVYDELPKTIAAAEASGYSLIDKVGNDGKMVEAACFNHVDTLHYAKLTPKITRGSEWHGAPFLLLYSAKGKNLRGIVLESVSTQPSPPWEQHPKGHPGMDFGHSSLHIWFTEPPENLSLSKQSG